MVGADASACVYKTALGGINRGYEVVVLENSVFSINNKYLNDAIQNYKKNNIKTMKLLDFLK